MNSAWLAWRGLRRLGYEAEAVDMARRAAEVVMREGLREYYEARSGAGMGATDFGWTALVLEMAEPRRAARG